MKPRNLFVRLTGAAAIFMFGAYHLHAQPITSTNAQWLRAADRTQQRIEHQAVALLDGRVLVIGGYPAEALDILFGVSTGDRLTSTEIYDPRSNSWSAGAQLPQSAGFQWAAVLTTGEVLAFGNFDPTDGSAGTFSALYDPKQNTWTATAPLPLELANDHAYMRAIVLDDGRVLSAGGGTSDAGPSDAALVFKSNPSHPAAGTWDYTRNKNTNAVTRPHRARASGALAKLKDGRVLFVGGVEGASFGNPQSSNAADLFDPKTGEWTTLPDMPVIPGERNGNGDLLDDGNTVNPGSRWAPIAETMPDGRVLIAGGMLLYTSDGENFVSGRRKSAVVFDPKNVSQPWTQTSPMNSRRWFSRSSVLRKGQSILVVGGGVDPSTCEIYNAASGTWSLTASFPSIDAFGSQLSGTGGNFLLTGGVDYDITPPDQQLGSVKSFTYMPGLPVQAAAPDKTPSSVSETHLLAMASKLTTLRDNRFQSKQIPCFPANEITNETKITGFSLGQNYPNPFNPTTIIAYDLPQRAHVTLRIYNVLGQVVATLVDGVKAAGHSLAEFDAGNLPSGAYFYRLEAGTYVETRRLILLK